MIIRGIRNNLSYISNISMMKFISLDLKKNNEYIYNDFSVNEHYTNNFCTYEYNSISINSTMVETLKE